MTSANNTVQARILNLTVNDTQLDLVTDEEFEFDPDEGMEDFELATATTTQTIPSNGSPTISGENKVDKASKEGLDELGIVDADGNYSFDFEARSVDSVTVEYLDAEDGTVDLEHEFNDVIFELEDVSHEKPVTFSWTGHINGDIELAVGKASA